MGVVQAGEFGGTRPFVEAHPGFCGVRNGDRVGYRRVEEPQPPFPAGGRQFIDPVRALTGTRPVLVDDHAHQGHGRVVVGVDRLDRVQEVGEPS